MGWAKTEGGDFAAAAESTRSFTKKIGTKAIEELKGLGYTKDDFVKWKGTYSEAIKNLAGKNKDIQVQQARLESVEKILELWK